MRSAKLVLGEMGIRIMIVLAIALAAVTCLAAEPASNEANHQPAAETPRAVGLERKLVFTESENQYPMLYDPDSELPPHRYAATVTLQFRYRRLQSELPSEVVGTTRTSVPPEFDRFFRKLLPPSREEPGYQHLNWLSELVEKMPEASRSPNSVVTELRAIRDQVETTSVSTPRGGELVGSNNERVFRCQVAVPGADKTRVEELMRAVILAIDLGFSPQCHKDFLATAGRLERYLEELEKTAEQHRNQIEAMNKELEGLRSYDDLNPEALASLVAHKRMISVDLAGIEARLQACRKILDPKANETVTGQVRTQIETVKITAEIELAGLAAKQTAIDEIVAMGRHRAELETGVARSEEKLNNMGDRQEEATQLLGEYREAINQNWAYPEVSDVTVSKIRWEPKTGGGKWWER